MVSYYDISIMAGIYILSHTQEKIIARSASLFNRMIKSFITCTMNACTCIHAYSKICTAK